VQFQTSIHIKNIEAIWERKNSNKENEQEDFDIDEHFYYHSHKGCSSLKHPHKIEKLQPKTEDADASDDVHVRVLSLPS